MKAVLNRIIDRFYIQLGHKRWQRKVIKLRKKHPLGSFIDCCGTKLGIVLGYDDYDSVEFWALDHQQVRSCSLSHCGPVKVEIDIYDYKAIDEYLAKAEMQPMEELPGMWDKSDLIGGETDT